MICITKYNLLPLHSQIGDAKHALLATLATCFIRSASLFCTRKQNL